MVDQLAWTAWMSEVQGRVKVMKQRLSTEALQSALGRSGLQASPIVLDQVVACCFAYVTRSARLLTHPLRCLLPCFRQSLGANEARFQFLKFIRSHAHGGSSFFLVRRKEDPVPLLPTAWCTVAISRKGVHFFLVDAKTHIHTVDLRRVASFHGDASHFRLGFRMGDRLHVVEVDTMQVRGHEHASNECGVLPRPPQLPQCS